MEIRITYSRDGGRERALPEETFVDALAGTLDQISRQSLGPDGGLAGQEFVQAAAAFIEAQPFKIAMRDGQLSLLGTFGIVAAQLLEDGAVPPRLVCPCCNEDQMDRIEAQDSGDFECQTCHARYSGETDGGRPSWKQSFNERAGDYMPRLYYVPAFDRYVSIPDGE